MLVTSVSDGPAHGCWLVRWADLTLLVDCALDGRPALQFAPCALVPQSSTGLRWADNGTADGLVKIANGVPFIDAQPEFGHVDLGTVQAGDIDAVLVSNADCLLGLASLASLAGFRAHVYATDPTVQFGRLLAEEMIDHLERSPAPGLSVQQRKALADRFEHLRQISGGPAGWRRVCTRQQLDKALDDVVLVAYNEVVKLVDGTKVVPLSSGYAIGACNWKITRPNMKVSVVAATSPVSYHPLQPNLKPLAGADVLLMSALNSAYPLRLEVVMARVKEHVQNAINQGGVALIPLKACGLIFDLLAILRPVLEGADTFGSGPKVYVVAPSAKALLAYANIYSEWLHPELTDSIYNPDREGPEEPFKRQWLEMVEQGRVKIYAGVEGDFSAEFKPGCVVFTTDSSLRFGPVTHLLPMLADNPNNTIICVDSDVDASCALTPYRPMGMKAVSCPLDSRLTAADATKMLRRAGGGDAHQPQSDGDGQPAHRFEYTGALATDPLALDAKGGCVLVPDKHDRTDKGAEFTMTCNNKIVMECGIATEIAESNDVIMATLDPELAESAMLTDVRSGRLAASPLSAHLHVDGPNVRIVAKPVPSAAAKFHQPPAVAKKRKPNQPAQEPVAPCPILYGALKLKEMLQVFDEIEVGYKHTQSADGSHIVDVSRLKVVIECSADLLSTNVRCDDAETRTLVREILTKCLSTAL